MTAGKPLWALVSDLFLRVKIEAMARTGGFAFVAFATPAELIARLASTTPEVAPGVVLVDLGARDDAGFALLEALAGRPDAPPTLAFFSHVDIASRRRAADLGATRIVPRSALVARFAELVGEVAA